MKLLSLYIMGGFGHIKPAQAIVEQFQSHGIEGQTYDVFSKDGQPNYNSANIYNLFTRSSLLLPFWNLITRHDLLPAWLFSPVHFVEVLQNRATIRRLRAISQADPDLIVTATHFTAALLAAKAMPDKTIFLYVTDIHPHGLWKLGPPNIHYLVPMEETKIDIGRYGIPDHRITLTSFPIPQAILHHNHQRFQSRLQTLKKRAAKLIDVLIISGGAGTGKMEMINLLKDFLTPAKTNKVRVTILVSTPQLLLDLIDFCSKNEATKSQVLIDRYTPASLYAALNKAEILITKAGGDITFEALAEGLPIYSLKDVGDHERLNRQYLELIGACKPLYYHRHPWDLIQSDIFSGEILLMAKSSRKHGEFHRQADSPQTILKLISAKPTPAPES